MLAVLLLVITVLFVVGPQLSRYYALRFSSIVAACMVVYELLLALGIGTWHWHLALVLALALALGMRAGG